MEYIIELIFLTAKPAMIIIAIYLAFLAVMMIIKKEDVLKRRKWFWKEALFVIYIFAVLKITGLIGGTWDFSGNSMGSFNLHFMTNESPKLMVLNFILFVPLGMFLPALIYRKGLRFMKTAATGFLFSGCIEMSQLLFVGRFADIDDIVFNTAGCMAGSLIAFVAEFAGVPVAVSILSVLWSLRYQMIAPGDVILTTFGVDGVLYSDAIYTEIMGVIFGIISFIYGLTKKSIPGAVIAVLAIGLAAYEGYMKYMM